MDNIFYQEVTPLVVTSVKVDHAVNVIWLSKNKALRLDLFGGAVLSLYYKKTSVAWKTINAPSKS